MNAGWNITAILSQVEVLPLERRYVFFAVLQGPGQPITLQLYPPELLSYSRFQAHALERTGLLITHPYCEGLPPDAADSVWKRLVQQQLILRGAPPPEPASPVATQPEAPTDQTDPAGAKGSDQ